MKLIDFVRRRERIRLGEERTKWSQLHGERFYNAWDSIFGLFDVELLQLGRYALSIQNSETENNMVSRATNPEKHDIYAETSGVFHFFPEKTRGVEDIFQSFDQNGSIPLPPYGQGKFKPFLKPVIPHPITLTDTNYKHFIVMRQGRCAGSRELCYSIPVMIVGSSRADSTLICYVRQAGWKALHEDAGTRPSHKRHTHR